LDHPLPLASAVVGWGDAGRIIGVDIVARWLVGHVLSMLGEGGEIRSVSLRNSLAKLYQNL
jgi:hypothetical protein